MRADNTGVAVAATITETNDQFLREAADLIRSRMSRSAEDIVEIGRKLIVVKDRIGHGNFLPWIDLEFGMSDQSAANFMNVARRFGDQIPKGLEFRPAVLYALAAPSTPEEIRTEITERAKAGEKVTAADVRAIKTGRRRQNGHGGVVDHVEDGREADRRRVTEALMDMLDLFERDDIDPAVRAAFLIEHFDLEIAGPKLSIRRLSRAIDALHAVFRSIAIDLDTAAKARRVALA
jgi:hypothetical protein